MKKLGKLRKKLMAGIMAAAMLFSTVLPDYIGIGKYLTFDSYAMAPGDSTGLQFNLTFVPNSGVMKGKPGWEGMYNRNMLRKEYFTGGTGEYADFGGKYVWCVANHSVHAPVGANAIVNKIYSYDDLPPARSGGQIDKFNFTLAVMGLYYFAQPTNVGDPYADLADYIIAKCAISAAFEQGLLKNEWEWDQMIILSTVQEYYQKEFEPDSKGSTLIADQLKAGGYKYGPNDSRTGRYDEYKLWQIWSAAHTLAEMDWQKGVGYAKNVTEPEMGSDGKYHVYAEFNADDVNGKYFESLKAQTMYGDWTYEGYSGGKMDFASPTGEVPAEGIADMAYEPGSSFDNVFTNFDEGQIVVFGFNGNYQDMLGSKLSGDFKVKIGTTTITPSPHGGEGGEVKRYKHEETWNATYNVNLYKFDSETGKPLEGSMFDILEAFDDSQLDETDLDRDKDNPGSYSGGGGSLVSTKWGVDDVASNWSGDTGYVENDADKYNWGNDEGTQFERWTGWDDPCTRDNDITNGEGQLMENNGSDEASGTVAHTDVKQYEYVKGYCGGHPAPEIEYAEPTGDPAADAAIEEANQALHDEAWQKWYEGVQECEKLAEEGGFFHAIDEGAAKAALEKDRDQFYKDFISLQYDYSAEEIAQREGYILHDGHTDDIPIEEIRISSSEYKDTDGASNIPHGGSGGGGFSMAPPAKLMNMPPTVSSAGMLGASLGAPVASDEEHAAIIEEAQLLLEEESIEAEGSISSVTTKVKETEVSGKESRKASGKDDDEVSSVEVITETVTPSDNVSEEKKVPEAAVTVEEEAPAAVEEVGDVIEIEEIVEEVGAAEEVKNISLLDRIIGLFTLTSYADEEKPSEEYVYETEEETETVAEAESKTEKESKKVETVEETESETETEAEKESETETETVKETEAESEKAKEETETEETKETEEKTAEDEITEATPSDAPRGADTKSETVLSGFFKKAVSKLKKAGTGFMMLLGVSLDSGKKRASTSFEESEVSKVGTPDSTIIAHTFTVFDHRVEGEVHINKRDFDLSDSDMTSFDDYAEINGDGTLEGAVYGLFARTPIVHPDGVTGTVFATDELVAIATTDRNGDASFSAITCAPGTTYDYTTGQAKHTGAAGPGNLHKSKSAGDAFSEDNEKYIGHENEGGEISITDSDAKDSNEYMKKSSNQSGVPMITSSTFAEYPISNNEDMNGNCWIGRPLLLGEYYVKELSRSEGYELSVYGASQEGYSNKTAFETGSTSLTDGTAAVVAGSWQVNTPYTGNEFQLTQSGIGEAGFDIFVNNVPASVSADLYPTVKSFYKQKESGTATIMVDDYDYVEVDATPGAFVLINGQKVEASVGDNIHLPNGADVTVGAVSAPEDVIRSYTPNNLFSKSVAGSIIEFEYADDEAFILQVNASLASAGYKAATTASPYILIPKAGTRQEWCGAINNKLADMLWCNAFSVEDAGANIALRYDYIQPSPTCSVVSDTQHDVVLVAEPFTYGTEPGHIWVPYAQSEWITYKYKTGTFVEKMTAKHKVPSASSATLYNDLSGITYNVEPAKTYWVYKAGDKLRASNGDIQKQYVKVGSHPETQPTSEEKKYYDASPKYESVTYDAVHQRYVIHVSQAQASYTNAGEYPYIGYELIWASSTAGGVASVYYANDHLKVSASASPKTAGLYIKYVTLSYTDGKVMEDAGTIAAPVKMNERPIRQRIAVKKDILLDADYDSDGKGESYRNNTFENAVETAVPDFRFKAYLKSNLERLYRKADGTITWLDGNGNVMTPVLTGETLTWTVGGSAYDWPEVDKMNGTAIDSLNVQPIFTEVAHEAGSKTAGRIANNVVNTYKTPSGNTSDVAMLSPFTTATRPSATDAIITNAALYSYVGKNTDKKVSDTLRDQANEGYTRLLETVDVEMEDGTGMRTIQKYNYEKFFDAIAVANGDKWDDNKPTYTLYKPIGNKNNRKARQVSNASRSDRVVQFAIDWYLQDEVSKLTNAVAASAVAGTKTEDEAKAALSANNYQTDLYDEALEKAIVKAENYLKPFFTYNLDDIYALQWDTEVEGGADGNTRTLSASAANTKADGNDEYYNTSAYLPYGAYIVVEQQPGYTGTDLTAIDYLQKHYSKDKPKEVLVPSIYQGTVSNTADNYSEKYEYDYSKSNEYWAAKDYLIRFGEEWNQNETGTNKHVIRAHSFYGNYEVYPYGLDIDKLTGSVSPSGAYTGFSITQDSTEPLKDYYNTVHHGEEGVTAIGTENGGNDSSKWNIESLNAGLEPTANGTSSYKSEDLRNRTFYASISEDAGTSDKVMRIGGTSTEDNVPGMYYDDNVPSMTGVHTAYDGSYAQMLVPWSVLDATDIDVYVDFSGYADVNEMNRFYRAKLRLEKLDSETHENILHDGATFQVYKAQRDATTGVVMVYSADTDITGSKEFVTAYCMKNTVMPVDPENPRGEYQGTVAAGTPVCYETDMVTLGDRYGNEVGEFEAFSTKVDVAAKGEMTDVQTTPANYIEQNAGYIEFPEPLGAGGYVLVETVVPSGYVRTKPVAVEIYSDKVSYYKEGNKSDRVIAAIFEEEEIRKDDADASAIGTDEEATNHKNKPQDTVDVARIFIEDAPIKLTVEKVKESSASSADITADKTVTYKVSGRVEGPLTEIGGRDDLEYMYLAGKYQGYAFYKGTLEYLAQLKKIYEADSDPRTGVEIVYDATMFSGYAYVTLPLETSDDDNKYVTGAKLTLVDALQLRRNDSYKFGDPAEGDNAFSFYDSGVKHGLIIERDLNNNVKRMYVEQGYAGAKTVYKPETDATGNPITTSTLTGYTKDGKPVYTTGKRYISETIERPDTDILYYDLDSLDIIFEETIDGTNRKYGYDKEHNRVELAILEHDKANYDKTDREISIFAFKGGIPVYEIVGGNFNNVEYNAYDKYIKVDAGSLVYHLDEDGNRDSLIDPKTGMAYVIEKAVMPDGTIADKFLVWAVEVYKDAYGNVIAMDKITTSRVGTIGENDASMLDVVTDIPSAVDPAGGASTVAFAGSYEHKESGSVSGMWKSDAGEESHHETSDRTNLGGQNMNGEILLDDNNGDFLKQYSPIYDESGNILYYQRSAETYDKGQNLYDRDGDFVRYDNSDNLKEYNDASYALNKGTELYDADQTKEDPATKKLYHRKGEGYVLENTWITSDKTPNDPFEYTLTDGQADIIKRIPVGTYIIEETFVPNGDTNGAYVRAFPVGITVNETTNAQMAKVVDHTTKIELVKIDAAGKYALNVLSMDAGGTVTGTWKEEKTSYSYGVIGGATLALYKAEKKYTTDYAKYPKGYYLVKSETTPLKYHPTNWKVSNPVELTAQWTTVKDQPIYLEGIPQGFYILEEISAPEGFVKAAPIEVEIDAALDVQELFVADDHTKVEIEKIIVDGAGVKTRLRGATMELHEAEVDGSGAVQYESDGTPKYKAAKLLTWVTSDEKEYLPLMKAFEETFNAHGVNGDTFSYIDDHGTTHTMNRVSLDYSYDWSLAGETALQYPTDAREVFADELGRKVRVSAYQQRQSGSEITYTYDYEFDWIDIKAINDYCDSYITKDGVRRFNYLPIGKKYVVVEAEAPAGYAKAIPKLIDVADTVDIQRYMIEDTEAKLIISKVIEGKTKEAEGITLSLYRAESGALVKDAAHLVETWVTGTDGKYTSDDALFGRIPTGYAIGDLRAHEVTAIPAGSYFLVEDVAADYYTAIEPLAIDYTDISEVKFVRVENKPVKGEVKLYKKDPNGNFLTGAVYEVKRYDASDLTTPVETLTYTDTTGTLDITNLEVGRADEKGEITPYTYTIREIKAPERYSVVDTLFTFKFDPKAEGGLSYNFGDFAKKEYTIIDRKTKFLFQKKDFDALGDDDTDQAFIDGAAIILYELTGIDVNGNPEYDTAHPVKTITTSKITKTAEIEGLVGGKSYVFVESYWPVGWNLMKPVIFTVSADGRKMTRLTNKLETISFETIAPDDFNLGTENVDIDSVKSATLHGRFVTKVENEIVDSTGALMESWPAGGTHVINIASGYNEEEAYTLIEKTYYSDGTVLVTDKETKSFFFDESGNIKFTTRTVDKTEIAVIYADGTKIDEINPVTDTDFEKVIANDVLPLELEIEMTQPGRATGEPIDPEKVIYNRTTFVNPSHAPATATVSVHLNDDTTFIDAGEGITSGKTITFTVADVPAFGTASVEFATVCNPNIDTASILDATVEIAGKTFTTTKAVPVIEKNCLTIFNELTGSGKDIYAGETEDFRVRLWYNDSGEELAGTYSYDGSISGTMKSGDLITLRGNEYVIINTGVYKNVHYTVDRLADGRTFIERKTEGDFTDKLGAAASFTRTVIDTSLRNIFRKGENYDVVEKTTYTDGISSTTNRIGFAVGENGAVDTTIAYDLKTKVAISKVDISDGHEIPGCTLTLYDTNGTPDDTSDDILIEQWVSEDKPHMFEGVLESGKTYRLEETSAAPGYAYTEDVLFEVDTEGYIVQRVKMVDKPTDVTINKSNFTTGEPVEGAKLQIIDKDGNIIKEWITDADGSERFVCVLNADETYTLHEEYSPDGYYYSHDETFTVNHDGTPQMTEMKNHEIVVVTPPEEPEKPVEPHPDYEMEKERTSLAPIKMGTTQYGFYRGDTVYYDVTIVNTGNMDLRMKVDDAYEHPELFTKPVIDKITFHSSKTTLATPSFGRTHSISGSVGDISIFVGGYAVVTYKAVVKDDTPENLSDHAKDDGMGYLNTARTYDVVGRYIEEGTNTEKTVDKDDFPELEDKEDDANTPVQEPENPGPGPDKPVTPVPGYIMEKERTTPAPNKKGTLQYGFYHGDTVYYDVTVTNTGNMPLTMDVDDVFEKDTYFSIPKAEKAVFHSQATKASGPMYGTLNSMGGNNFNITIAVGAYAVLTYSAVVMDITPEDLSNHAPDDGMAYLNTAHTYNVDGKYLEEGTDGTVTEKTVTKDDYPEELGDKEDDAHTPVQVPEEPTPHYEMDKERVTPAPAKAGTDKYGFFHGDTVTYEVHIENNGDMPLKMYVSDEFEASIAKYFLDLHITGITFDGEGSDISEAGQGVGNKTARIRLAVGAKATVTYTAVVADDAPENLSYTAPDDGNGYLNIAKTFNVKAEKPDGTEGDKEEYPGIPDKEDEGNTPVQEPKVYYPRYTMEKERITPAPLKEGTERYGFFRGDTVEYEVRVTNTGTMPLKIYVSDEFEGTIAKYFKNLHITKIEFNGGVGSDISEAGYGIGKDKARIRIEPGVKAVLTYSAVVSDDAPEFLSFTAPDDGNGYLNIARTYDVKAEKPDGSEGDKHEYPSIPDMEDEGNTPVQEPGKPDDEHPRPYPIIWLLKEGEGDPGIMLQGGTFVLLDADKKPLTGPCAIEQFVMRDFWQEWDIVLKADATYYMHEVEPPRGFAHAEDVAFTVDHYGEDRQVVMIDKPTKVQITKTDITGEKEVPGCELELRDKDGHLVDSWTSGDTPHYIEGKLVAGEEYTLVEVNPAPGYAYAEDITFKVSTDGTIDKVVMKDKVTRVEITKTDITGTKEVPGCILELRDENGIIVDKWTSGTTPHVFEAELIAGKEYTLIEVNPAPGYAYAEDITFKVSEDGTVDKIVMKDKVTQVEITKTDITGDKELPGAHLILYDAGGNKIEEWISGTEPHVIEAKLIAGDSYVLHEEGAPDGYAYTSDIVFTVSKDGRIDKVVMKDEAIHIEVKKQNDSGLLITGAVLQILDKDGKEVIKWTTDGTAKDIKEILNADTEYVLHEVSAPSGYKKAADIRFTTPHTGEKFTVTMTDVEVYGGGGGGGGGISYSAHIHKFDEENGKALAGAQFTIYLSDQTTVYKVVTTDASGNAYVTIDKHGTYFYRETKAPDGYEATDEIAPLDLTSVNSVKVDVPNTKIKGKIDAKYNKNINGNGNGKFGRPNSVLGAFGARRFGDDFPLAKILAILFACLALFGCVQAAKKALKKDDKKEKKDEEDENE